MPAQYFRFSARPPKEPRRSPLLERLLARADGLTSSSDWRADAFRLIAPTTSMPAVASAALLADCGETNASWVCLAAPVHYLAEMDNVRLAAEGMLALRRDEAQALAVDFNRVWGNSGTRMIAGPSANLYCVFDRALHVTTCDPADVLDRHIGAYLPAGGDAPVLKQLMSEIEMWLYEHTVNGGRTAQGLPPVSGLWLWGGGVGLSSLPQIEGFCAGHDVFFNALAAQAPGSGVIVMPDVPGSDAWQDAESRWLAPAVAQLRFGDLSRLELSAGARRFSVTARAALRFWRRRKPWWEWIE